MVRTCPLLFFCILLTSCGKLDLAHKYFLNACAGDGPETNKDFTLNMPPFDLETYYSEIRSFERKYKIKEIDVINYRDKSYPILWINQNPLTLLNPSGGENRARLLVVSGIHGDERAALLAVPELLRELSGPNAVNYSAHWDVSIIVPANPVSAAYGSRYNSQGCDVNRDFNEFDTQEATAIKKVIEQFKPDLIVSMHEGPQNGFFMIATAAADTALAEKVISQIEDEGITLAKKSFLGFELNRAGLSVEGKLMASGKRWIRLGSLGTYLESLNIGTFTTESSWNSDNYTERIRSHFLLVKAILNATLVKKPTSD